MKKNKFNIICSWLLLLCFAAGQYMVYTHQHNAIKGISKITTYSAANDHHPEQTIKEKCYLCDAMHHTALVTEHILYVSPQTASLHTFKAGDYNFISISLVLAAGRAPPIIS